MKEMVKDILWMLFAAFLAGLCIDIILCLLSSFVLLEWTVGHDAMIFYRVVIGLMILVGTCCLIDENT